MREVAQHLEEIAEVLPARERSRELLLRQNADRLTSAATLLIAEVNAGDARNAGKVASVAMAGALAVGALVVPGMVEGASSALVERALEAQANSIRCLAEVEQEAALAWEEFDEDLGEEIDSIRRALIDIGTQPSSPPGIFEELEAGLPSQARAIASGLMEPDLDVPNRRQRIVFLRSAVDQYLQLVSLLGARSAAEEINVKLGAILERLDSAREAVEAIAAHDETLFPPQPIRPRKAR